MAGNSRANRSAKAQCVVARWPSSRPASAARKVPVQTVTTRRAVRETLLIQPTSSASARASWTPPPPGSTTVSTGSRGSGSGTRCEGQAGRGGHRLAADRGHHHVVAAVGQQRCAGEHLVRPHHIERLHAGEADDHHLASHEPSVGQTTGVSSTPCTPQIRTWPDLARRRPSGPWQTVCPWHR